MLKINFLKIFIPQKRSRASEQGRLFIFSHGSTIEGGSNYNACTVVLNMGNQRFIAQWDKVSPVRGNLYYKVYIYIIVNSIVLAISTASSNNNAWGKRKFKLLLIFTYFIFCYQNRTHYSMKIAYDYQFYILTGVGKMYFKNFLP